MLAIARPSCLIILAYTAHYRLCDYALYKSTIEIDIDNNDLLELLLHRRRGSWNLCKKMARVMSWFMIHVYLLV